MMPSLKSLLNDIPPTLPEELCQTLLQKPTLRIERILSQGHQSPTDFWYDQDQDEWVLLVEGQARLSFANGESTTLHAGDYLLIPAHCKHRVDWTPADRVTIWLAIYMESQQDPSTPKHLSMP